MTKETKTEITAALSLLKNTLVENNVSMAVTTDENGKYQRVCRDRKSGRSFGFYRGSCEVESQLKLKFSGGKKGGLWL